MSSLRDKKRMGLIFALAVMTCCALIPTASFAADVDVYAGHGLAIDVQPEVLRFFLQRMKGSYGYY